MNSNKSNKESFYVDTKTMVNEDYWLNISGGFIFAYEITRKISLGQKTKQWQQKRNTRF